jgi:hypothetical protein
VVEPETRRIPSLRTYGVEIAMLQAHAFISYVRENREIVDHLARDLQAFGIKVWLDRNDIMPGQWWKDAINEAIQKGAFFVACFSKELSERQETYMHGELRLAIDRLRNIPKSRVWFIPVLINETEIPSHNISDHETLKDINAIMLFENWDEGLSKILRAMKLDDPDFRRALHLIDLIRYHLAERRYAIERLACIADVTRLAVPALAEALRDANSDVRGLAAEALEMIGPAAAEAVPALVKALRDADWRVRGRAFKALDRLAAEALGKIGPAAVPALAEALRDADWRVHERAAEALGKIGPAAAEAVPTLAETLRDVDSVVRVVAAAALEKIKLEKIRDPYHLSVQQGSPQRRER